MRRSMTSLCTVASLMAVAGVMTLVPLFAKAPVSKEDKPADKGVAIHVQVKAAVIPECITKLKLSAEQDTEIKGIIQKYDDSLAKVWTQFGERYIQMISMESSMLAAVEDNLTEPQREQVRDHRRKTAHQEKINAATNDKPNKSVGKTASAVEDAAEGVSVALTAEQESAADMIQEKYHPQLHSLHRDVQGLHARLLSLEADKLVQIEKILSKDQVAMLRKDRQNAPVAPKLAESNTEPKPAE